MQYRVLYGNDEDNLAKKVNLLISEGWQVQGGVAAVMLGANYLTILYQAMTKE